ncbi:transcription factor Adf-1-like isoform X2 [Coccinella septempunctata]|uniref:transcription factor Adf-1-like isoform X2 n=1 Tax=Coccinella septempunctata TaxID=41139 RepID=UPI001D0612BE|nr:transcription factor Adf-1-like isoform X2 [Coccinella septempunctata]
MDVEEQLIDCVREERILYDRSHRKYMDTNLKMRIWRSIATKCGINSGDAAKVLWKKLRDSYRASRKRKPSGSAAPFANRWKYDMQMSFLQPFMRDRSRKIDWAMQEDIAETQETANSVPLQKSVAEESQEHLPSEEEILTATHCSPETKCAITSSSKAQEKGETNDRREEIRSTLHEKDDPLKSFFDSIG